MSETLKQRSTLSGMSKNMGACAFLTLLLAFTLLLFGPATSEATMLYVPGDYATIQGALDAAVSGDTVVVSGGTYTGPANKNLDFNGKAIALWGDNSVTPCVIDSEGDGRAIFFNDGETSATSVSGFTFINGYIDPDRVDSCGGGIRCENGSSPVIVNCVFKGNHAYGGGGVYAENSSPIIMNSSFSGNSVDHYGGAIYFEGSGGAIVNCTITGNRSYGGGGIFANASTALLTNSIVWYNSATSGVEIKLRGGSYLTVTYSIVNYGTAQIILYDGSVVDYAGNGNLESDPLFVTPGYFNYLTWVEGDYHLSSSSPAIDTGDPASDYSLEPAPNGGRINMGAYGNSPDAATSRMRQFVSVADLNGNGSADLAAWKGRVGGSDKIFLKDGSDGGLISTATFSPAYSALGFKTIPDMNSNGVSDLAMLATDDTGWPVAQVRDALTGSLINDVWFRSDYAPSVMVVVPDFGGSSADELAMLGTNDNDFIMAQVRDASTGSELGEVYFNKDFPSKAFAVVPNFAGSPADELVSLGVHPTFGWTLAQIRDASTGLVVKNIWFNSSYAAEAMVVMPNFGGSPADELAVLGIHSSGAILSQIRDASTGLVVSNLWFNWTYHPVAFRAVPNFGGSLADELVVLGRNDAGAVLAQVRDASTGLVLKNMWFNGVYVPKAFAVVPDLNSNGVSELAVWGEDEAGVILIQIRDASTGLVVSNVWLTES